MPKLVVIPFSGYFVSPAGILVVQNTAQHIQRIYFLDEKPKGKMASNDLTALALSQLKSYFEGTIRSFDLPLQPEGTVFQQRVWEEIASIKYGTKSTYQTIANQINDSSLSRATGAAIGKNPIAVIIPCHRVVASNGSLTGYAWGLQRKQWLLDFEAKQNGTYDKLF
jgi:methylated-DNA-[protein]-cysteine S-methyltransferase